MRSRTIEFLGAPGIGKSSIYEALCKKWHTKLPWIHPDELLRRERPPISHFRDFIEHSARRILQKNTHQEPPENGGHQFIEENERLANFCWTHLNDSGYSSNVHASSKFRAAFYLYRDFCKYQAIEDTATEKLCILDEGLLQKSFLIHDEDEKIKEILDEYLPLLPLPRAVLWVDTDNISEIVRRLKSRRKIIASHLGESDAGLVEVTKQWRKLLQFIAEKLSLYEVDVYRLDAEKRLSENVHEISEILMNCSGGDRR